MDERYIVLGATRTMTNTSDFFMFNISKETVEYMTNKEIRANINKVLNIVLDSNGKLKFNKNAWVLWDDINEEVNENIKNKIAQIGNKTITLEKNKKFGRICYTIVLHNCKREHTVNTCKTVNNSVYNAQIIKDVTKYGGYYGFYSTETSKMTIYDSYLVTCIDVDSDRPKLPNIGNVNSVRINISPIKGIALSNYGKYKDLTRRYNIKEINNDDTINSKIQGMNKKAGILGLATKDDILYHKDKDGKIIVINSTYGILLGEDSEIGYECAIDIIKEIDRSINKTFKLNSKQYRDIRYNCDIYDTLTYDNHITREYSDIHATLDSFIASGKLIIT